MPIHPLLCRTTWLVHAGILLSLELVACGSSNDGNSANPNQLVDGRDGRTYRTKAFGSQVWMTENLAVGVVVKAAGYGEEGAINRVCPQTYPDPSEPTPCDLYGGYYVWNVALALPKSCNEVDCSAEIQSPHQGICPSGWHIPSGEDFQRLADFVAAESGLTAVDENGHYSQVGAAIRDNSACTTPGTEAPASGFAGLPSGYANDTGYVTANGVWTFWQVTTQEPEYYSNGWGYSCLNDSFYAGGYYKSHALPVRCLKD